MAKQSPAEQELTELLGMPLHALQEEFILVAAMQRQIMPDPERIEVFADYDMHGKTLPAAIAGGDYYDFIDLEGRFGIGNRIGVVIADASGHGLAAAMLIRDFNTALYMGISFQSYYEKDTTSLLFTKMNRRMCRSSQHNQYISCFYGELRRNGILRYVNAGHPSPLLFQKDQLMKLDAGGAVLGAFRDLPVGYEVAEVQMDKDDVLVCFTDGILEATNSEGEEYGRARVIALAQDNRHLGARDLYQIIMEDVGNFSQQRGLADDQTLVVIKKEGKT
jgi:sigma-B regulation protein RsbU (phosphoserine phosphatase)